MKCKYKHYQINKKSIPMKYMNHSWICIFHQTFSFDSVLNKMDVYIMRVVGMSRFLQLFMYGI